MEDWLLTRMPMRNLRPAWWPSDFCYAHLAFVIAAAGVRTVTGGSLVSVWQARHEFIAPVCAWINDSETTSGEFWKYHNTTGAIAQAVWTDYSEFKRRLPRGVIYCSKDQAISNKDILSFKLMLKPIVKVMAIFHTRFSKALRIEVNDGNGCVKEMLGQYLNCCTVAGRKAAIRHFHSIEDRIGEKTFFKQVAWWMNIITWHKTKNGCFKIIYKKNRDL